MIKIKRNSAWLMSLMATISLVSCRDVFSMEKVGSSTSSRDAHPIAQQQPLPKPDPILTATLLECHLGRSSSKGLPMNLAVFKPENANPATQKAPGQRSNALAVKLKKRLFASEQSPTKRMNIETKNKNTSN